MARGLTKRQQAISAAFDNLCTALGRALGAADGARSAADHAHVAALVELMLREQGLAAARTDPTMAIPLANPQLAAVVARVAADEDAAFGMWRDTGPQALENVVAHAAPGAAGLPADEWIGQFGKADGVEGMPALWRIGAGRIGGSGTGFDVAVPLLDESHLQITADRDRRAEADALVENLLMRVLSHVRPGLVSVHVWDTGQFSGSLPGLYPLTRTDLLTVHHPGRLGALLEQLSDRIRRLHTRLLVDGLPSLQALAGATGARTEPWIIAVLMGDHQALPDEEFAQLQRVARGGPACGVHLVLVDVPMRVNAAVETVTLRGDTTTSSMTGPHVVVELDRALPPSDVTAACQTISDEHGRWRDLVSAFHDLLPPPDRWGTESSKAGLRAPVGFAGVLPVDLVLADASPHALIGGPSGTGKTNLLLTMIGSLAARYDPDELAFYLLDFKEGVSFAQFAPGRKDPTWLPHARLIGINVNTDREFGLALLQFLADEMRRRSEVAKQHEVTKLEELRATDPDGHWPRIVAVIDEFQYLFAERDSVSRTAIALLEDVARRGRSQGIHLVLASQDVSGIEAFWGRSAIFEQFVLRIALPRARKVLADLNEASLDLPRWHAVLNHESGIKHGNEIVRVPDATGRGSIDEVQRTLWEAYAAGRAEPRLFDGSKAPRLAQLLPPVEGPLAVVGQIIDVEASPATVPLPAAPGRNIGVLGSAPADAVAVLGAAATSLVRTIPRGGADVVIAPLVAEAVEPARLLEAAAAQYGHTAEIVGLDGIVERLRALADEVAARTRGAERRFCLVVLYAADAADSLLGYDGTEALQKVLRFGPEVGIHVVGWWRSMARLRSLLAVNASVDDLGAWVALDVQGNDLGSLLPTFGVDWSSRPGRGLFFDRSQHSEPRVVIVPSLEGVP